MHRKLVVILTIFSCLVAVSIATLMILNQMHVVTFFPKKYKVTFKNYNEDIIYETEVLEGQDVSFDGVKPTYSAQGYTYYFNGWDKSLENIREDTVFHPVFEQVARSFTVTFVNFDDKVLYEETVRYGEAAYYVGETPRRDRDEYYSYEFSGWDKTYYYIREDTVVKALFNPIDIEYCVTFFNFDKAVLDRQYVKAGNDAIYHGRIPNYPGDERYDYTFKGWDIDYTNVQSDLDVHATYQMKETEYVVNFYNYDDTLLFSDFVADGNSAEYYGALPTREKQGSVKFKFKGWDANIDEVHGNLDVYALYDTIEGQLEVKFYSYKYYSELELLYVDYVNQGGTASYEGLAPDSYNDHMYDYNFIGWDRELTNVQEDLVVYAKYEKSLRTYTCYFYNYDGTFLYKTYVEAGKGVSYRGETPIKEENGEYYKFMGWSNDTNAIYGDTNFYAQFDKTSGGGGGGTCVYYFHNDNGEVIDLATASFGESAQYSYGSPMSTIYPENYFWGWNESTYIDENALPINHVYAIYCDKNWNFIYCFYSPYGQLLYASSDSNENIRLQEARNVLQDKGLYDDFIDWHFVGDGAAGIYVASYSSDKYCKEDFEEIKLG